MHTEMVPYETGERELAASHLYETGERDLMLYDRGYAAFWLFAMHRDLGRHFCARLKLDFNAQVKAFAESGQRSQIVTVRPDARARRQCEEYNHSDEPVTIRLIRVDLGKGKIEVLATTLIDGQQVAVGQFAKLYALRWEVEENYKREKLRLEIENFSSRTPRTLRQDFHAKIIALNLAVVMEWVAQAIAERIYKERKHIYQINFANALSVLKNALIRWMAKGMPWDGLLRLLTEIVGSVEPIKPGRSYPRIKRKVNVRQFHANYKRCA